MRAICCLLTVLLARQAICGIIRNPPAFSKPVYSDSYLPAAMQVIFHAVEQLKTLQSEEAIQSYTNVAGLSTSPITHVTQNEQTTVQYSSTITIFSTPQSVNETKFEQEEEKAQEPSKDKVDESKEREPSKDKVEESSQDKIEESKMKEPSANKTEEPSKDKMTESPDDEIKESKIKETSKDKIKPSLENEKEDSNKEEEVFKDNPEEGKLEESSQNKIENPLKDKEEFELEESSEDEIEDSRTTETSGSIEIAEESMENPSRHQESPEVNEETPETNYATPETNYESPEVVHAVQETNQEVPEENHEWKSASSRTTTETKLEAVTASGNIPDSTTKLSLVEKDEEKKKNATIDSVVQGVYEILRPTTSRFVDEDVGHFLESKNAMRISSEKMEDVEEEDDETRFTQLGERVTQVPRPSLSSYLRRSNVPPSATLQQLASLYDSLSKDARKQGLGKYTGYSDQVLNTLETSAEGGIGPQLKKILDKVLERNELMREDAKSKTSQAVRDLNNPSSMLSKELRPLLPLRYSP